MRQRGATFVFVNDYWNALRDSPSRGRTVLAHGILPVLVGAVSLMLFRPVSASQAIDVVAIVAGLLFSMLVLLIDVRGRVRRSEDPRATHGDRNSLNLDYAYYATHYAIVAGFAGAALLLLPEDWWQNLPRWAQVAYNWTTIALVTSFALAVLHCLARLRRAYQVFGRGDN